MIASQEALPEAETWEVDLYRFNFSRNEPSYADPLGLCGRLTRSPSGMYMHYADFAKIVGDASPLDAVSDVLGPDETPGPGPTRFNYGHDGDTSWVLPAHEGRYMLYADHLAIMTRKAAPNSIEDLADVTLERIAEFFGKCVNQPDFCGFSVEEAVDAFDAPVSLTLAVCQMVGDEPLRKIAK